MSNNYLLVRFISPDAEYEVTRPYPAEGLNAWGARTLRTLPANSSLRVAEIVDGQEITFCYFHS